METKLNNSVKSACAGPAGIVVVSEEDVSFKEDMEAFLSTGPFKPAGTINLRLCHRENQYAKSLAKRSVFLDLMAEIGLRGITAGGIGPWDLAMAVSLPFWFWTKQRHEIQKEAVFNLEGEAKSAL